MRRASGVRPKLCSSPVRAREPEDVLPHAAVALDRGAEVAAHELGVEDLVPGGHGRVRGEDRRRPDLLDRLVAADAGDEQLAHALEHEERGVALVHVEDRRLEPERPQRAHAADPEDELLPQPLLAVAAVQRPGDAAGAVGVALDVRVEEVEARAPGVGAPDPHRHVLAVEVDADLGLLERQRQPRGVVRRIALDLPAGLVEPLAEVALPVQEPHGDERHAEVRGRLEVVAREHAEAAGVDRQALVEPELGGEVRDEEVAVVPVPLPPGLALELRADLGPRLLERDAEAGIVGRAREGLVRELGEQGARVVLDPLPRLGVEPLEQARGRRGASRRRSSRPALRARRGRSGGRSRVGCPRRVPGGKTPAVGGPADDTRPQHGGLGRPFRRRCRVRGVVLGEQALLLVALREHEPDEYGSEHARRRSRPCTPTGRRPGTRSSRRRRSRPASTPGNAARYRRRSRTTSSARSGRRPRRSCRTP